MADVSHKLIQDDNSPLTTVDDLFTHLTIPQIQKLSNEYKVNIDNAKADLHTLVGSKYRDLIKIAEDIEKMNYTTIEADQKLSQLSYKSSKFLSTSSQNTYSKFHSSIRKKKATIARNESKVTILRNLILTKLTKLDLRITSKKSSPVLHTSILIHYSKVYYTIGTLFKEILDNERALNEKFRNLRNNFNNYLELELSRYSLFTTSFYSSYDDRFKLNQRLLVDELTTTKVLVEEDLEIVLEDEQFDEDDPVDNFDDEEYININFESYNRKSLPIINYIVSYIILNHQNSDLDSIDKVARKFIDLRYAYMRELVSNLKKLNARINFYPLFKYIENTLNYVDSYFLPINNEMVKQLQAYTKLWSGSKIIGFKSWVEEQTINFDQKAYTKGLSDRAKKEIDISLSLGAHEAFKLTSDLLSSRACDISESLTIFHNFIMSLKNMNYLMSQNDLESKFVGLFQEKSSNYLIDLLDLIISGIKSTYLKHFDLLDSDIIDAVKSAYLSKSNKETSPGLFSLDLVDIMDENLDRYINTITQSVSSLTLNDDVLVLLDQWFNFSNEYSKYIQPERAELSKLMPSNCLSNIVEILSKTDNLSLGAFDSTKIVSDFTSLRGFLNDKFWEKIDTFIMGVDSQFNEDSQPVITQWYSVLEIVLIIKSRTVGIKDSRPKIFDKLSNLARSSYESIISRVSDDLLVANIESHINDLVSGTVDKSMDDYPVRPTLYLSSVVYQASSYFLSASMDSTEFKYGQLFVNEHYGKLFEDLKNKWFEETIDHVLMQGFTKIKESIVGEVSKDAKIKAQHLFANVVYLLQFTQESVIVDSKNKIIANLISKMNAEVILVDEAVCSIIVRGVADFFRANKNINVPLVTI